MRQGAQYFEVKVAVNRKSLLQTLTMLACQPNKGNNLNLAKREIVRYLKPLDSNTSTLKSELEWMLKATSEIDGSQGILQDIRLHIAARIRALDEEK